jgi:trehalose/maltose hydrolase-like predicted phosphorylase
VGAAIFYNIWRYYQTTGDFEFLLDHGAEMMLNISYYEPRTSHGSTLSYVVHAAVLADLDAQRSWEMLMRALVPEALTISMPP